MGDVLELMDTHRGHVRVFFEHRRELNDKQYAAIAAKRERYEKIVREVIVRGAEDGTLRNLDPDLATLALGGMCTWTTSGIGPTAGWPAATSPTSSGNS